MDSTGLQFIIVTGLSGAGKTQALRALEDLGFYCVDNLPPALIETLVDFFLRSEPPSHCVGLVIDVRGGEFFGDLLSAVDALHDRGIQYRLVYLDADDEVLLRRFEETRRRHPVPTDSGLAESIQQERALLRDVRERADVVIDTTTLPPNALKRQLASVISNVDLSENLQVHVVSFGFKHGLPMESDLAFDVRFLPNPHHELTLRGLTGLDPAVKEYVMASETGREFLRRFRDFLTFCLRQYAEEGKAYLTIGIGCTGGRHRSVMLAEEVASWARALGYRVNVTHRDIQLEKRRYETLESPTDGVEGSADSSETAGELPATSDSGRNQGLL